jgi:hypothetical protein
MCPEQTVTYVSGRSSVSQSLFIELIELSPPAFKRGPWHGRRNAAASRKLRKSSLRHVNIA